MGRITDTTNGGKGGGSAGPDLEPLAMTPKGRRLVGRAISRQWQIPDQVLEALPEEVGRIALNLGPKGGKAKHKTRDRLRAGQLLVMMQRANQDAEHHQDRMRAAVGDGHRALVASEAVQAIEEEIPDPELRDRVRAAIMQRAGPQINIQVNVGDMR